VHTAPGTTAGYDKISISLTQLPELLQSHSDKFKG